MPTLRFDPDYQRVVAAFAGTVPPVPVDAPNLRQINDTAIAAIMRSFPCPEDSFVKESLIQYTSTDETIINLHHFEPRPSPDMLASGAAANANPGAAILYIHGGGHVSGSVKAFRKDIVRYAFHTQTAVFAPAYRLSPEKPFPKALQDVFSALEYLVAQAATLRIDPARIGILGISAGGGLAVAAALMARDARLEPAPRKLVLVAPMLDDRARLEEGSAVRGCLTWTERHNQIAWAAYMGDSAAEGGEAKAGSGYVVPPRAEDMRGLPSTYIDVGGLDLFRRESMEFAERLARADVQVEFHLYPGVPHAWEWVTPGAAVTREAVSNRVRALKDLWL